MWRVITKRNKEITMSFLPAGHTKFSPDWCFGLLKQRFRRTEVNSLSDIVSIVNQSSYVNSAQLVGTHEGEILVKTFDCTGYLATFFKKIPSIKKNIILILTAMMVKSSLKKHLQLTPLQ